ncbi:MAG: ATP-binding cassette domain-containing protein [Methylobacter sp.]|nr:ATP-binding cassette domain-containing protein [Methylobacter sp.]
MPLLEIRHAGYKAGQKKILDDLKFSIREGEMHALIGTNGTGKTTLARLIMGCEGYRLSSGQINFADQDIGEWPMFKRTQLGISMIWQEPARFEGIMVRDYLSLGRSNADLSDCLAQAGLNPGEYLDRPLDKTMSGGKRKRIELASMLGGCRTCVTSASESLRCYIRDGSRPPEVGLQESVSNRPVLLRLKYAVVSDCGKGIVKDVR